MHIETRGHGPALGLIHGWAMHSGLFGPLVDRLEKHHTLHLVDLPGHGHSVASDVALDPSVLAAELVDRVPDAAWLGWSLGGLVAMRAALDHPDRVRALVLVASSPRFVKGDDWPYGVGPSLFGDFGSALQRDFRGTLEGFLALEALGSSSAQDEARKLRLQAFERGEPVPAALQQGLQLLDSQDLRGELPALRVPSLWIAGRRDRMVPPEAMAAAAALAPGGRSIEIANAGHAPFLGAADEVAEAINGFLQAAVAGVDA